MESVNDRDGGAQGQFSQQEIFNLLLRSFEESDDTIVIRRVFVDMAGDLASGVFLSRVVYWTQPSKKDGETKLRIEHGGHLWLARGREEWWEECRLTAKQVDRIVKILTDKGLIKSAIYQFDGTPKLHIRLVPEAFTEQYLHFTGEGKVHFNQKVKSTSTQGESGSTPEGKVDFDQKVKSSNTRRTARHTARETTQHAVVVASPNPLSTPDTLTLINELTARGISPKVAAELVANHTNTEIKIQLDCLSDREPKDAARVLVKSIRESWAIPQSYRDRIEAAQRAEIAAQDKQARAAQKAAQESATAQEMAALDALWEKLDERTRERIEKEALEKLGVLGRSGRAQAALVAMRRQVVKERLQSR